ncbi:MAG TPA: hypothetical protein VJ831_00080 [Jatrophihabitantaceae bacterium]|nr:hypothetical protein [Jatrophihabitantaceae bacterium]
MQVAQQAAPRRLGMRWVAGALGLAVAGAAAIALAPSSAGATTVTAQLSLSGVATQGNILGGTQVGVHPGDTVNFQASALPTAGLDNIPMLGPLLDDLLTKLLHTSYQVVLHLPASFPGGKRDVTLGGPESGKCKGTQSLPVNFANIGTYNFTWTVQYVLPNLLGCTTNSIGNSNLNLLKSAGIALNSTNQWVGQIVVATNPPPPGISIQLPGVSVAPNLPVVGQVPTLGIGGVNLPTIPVNLPSLIPTLPGGGGSGGGSSTPPPGGGTGTGVECVPCTVVPSVGLGGGDNGGGSNPGSPEGLGQGIHNPTTPVTSATRTVTVPPASPSSKPPKTRDLSANKAPGAQMPVLLAIIAIIALGLVTATYARLYLLRRNV